jgi:hypothetical protein
MALSWSDADDRAPVRSCPRLRGAISGGIQSLKRLWANLLGRPSRRPDSLAGSLKLLPESADDRPQPVDRRRGRPAMVGVEGHLDLWDVDAQREDPNVRGAERPFGQGARNHRQITCALK